MQKRWLYTTLAGVFVMLAANPASAQTATEQPSDDSDEIVVTAERFEQSAQRTPLSIEVLSADDLQGLSDVRQLETVSPGVSLAPAGNVVQTYIRGIGTYAATNQQEAAVAFHVDGVYLATTGQITPAMFDLQRVEILKGPQGTLYGRNASGGAVNLITRGPSLDGFEGYVEAEGGDYDLMRFAGAVNIPLGDTLAIRIAAQDVSHEGYLSDGTDDQDLTAGRLRLLWDPSNAVTFRLGVDAAQIGGLGAGSSLSPNPTDDDFIGALDPDAQTGPLGVGTSLLSFPPNPPPYRDVDQLGVFAQLDVDLGFANLTILPAYREESSDSLNYVPGYFYGEDTDTEQTSLEVRLANQGERARWLVGAYYFTNDQDMVNTVRNETFAQNLVAAPETQVETYAVFGETTFSLTDTLRLIAGARWTSEDVTWEGQANAALFPPGVPGGPHTTAFNPWNPFTNPTGEFGDYFISENASDEAVTWRAGFELDLAPDSLLFATVSRGFKAGGFFVDRPEVDASYDPEFVTAYTIGSRNRFMDGQLQLNSELFYWEIEDQQIAYVGANSSGGVAFLTDNAGQATMYGANIDITVRPTDNDTVRFAAEYLHAEYDEFIRTLPVVSPWSLPPANAPCTSTIPSGGPPPRSVVDCSGAPMLRAPEFSGTASYEHVFDLNNGGDIALETNLTFATERYLAVTFSDEMKADGYILGNASLTYNSPGGGFDISAWVRNIGDERVMTGGGQFNTPYGRPTLMPPRTWGISLRHAF